MLVLVKGSQAESPFAAPVGSYADHGRQVMIGAT
jgi:hypothetical protein